MLLLGSMEEWKGLVVLVVVMVSWLSSFQDVRFFVIRFSGEKKGNFLLEMKIDKLRMKKWGREE